MTQENFPVNNCFSDKGLENPILKKLEELGVGLYIDPSGDSWIRHHIDGNFKKIEKSKLSVLVASLTERELPVNFFTGNNIDVFPNEIRVVSDKFTPHAPAEFYQEKEHWYRTSLRPTKAMLLKPPYSLPDDFHKKIENTLFLIKNLCNGDSERVEHFINWLAGFLQTRRKPQQAIVFRGSQGTGKGLLAECTLTGLFGESQTVIVDNDRLTSTFKNWLFGKMFYVFDEIEMPDKKQRGRVSGTIKQLITNPRMQAEAKFKDAGETELFGAVIIFSNKALPIEIETTDRRMTVFQTGEPLKKQGIDTGKLKRDLESEVLDFALYLKSYKVDWEAYDQCMDTPEKEAITSATTDRYSLFISMLRKRDPSEFLDHSDEPRLYQDLEYCFEHGFKNSDLLELFNYYFEANETPRSLPKKLRVADPALFDKSMAKKIKGYPRFIIS